MSVLDRLPERGWVVVRDLSNEELLELSAYDAVGICRVQRSGPGIGVFEARLTGAGREYVRLSTPPQ